MRSIKLGACVAVIAATLLAGCSADSGESALSADGTDQPTSASVETSGPSEAPAPSEPAASEEPPMDDGTEVFSGTVSAPDHYCDTFHSSADSLLFTLSGAADPFVEDYPGTCGRAVALPNIGSGATAELSVRVEPADAAFWIDPTFPDMMAVIRDSMEQLGLTEQDMFMPDQFSVPGWTYGYDTLTGRPEGNYGEIGLVLTTDQGLLQCRYRAHPGAPLSQDAVTATCNEFRDLVYSE